MPKGLLDQHDCCCQIPTLSQPRMSWRTKSMRYHPGTGDFLSEADYHELKISPHRALVC